MNPNYKSLEMACLLDALFQGLSGNLKQASWTPSMHACYRIATKRIRRIGIELEYIFGAQVPIDTPKRRKDGDCLYNGLAHTNYRKFNPVGEEFELVQLFPTDKPTDLISSVVRFTRKLKQLNIDTTGSIHCSVVWTLDESIGRRNYSGRLEDFKGDRMGKGHLARYENKKFSGYLLEEDLLAQLLLMAFSFQTEKLDDFLLFRELIIEARNKAIGPKRMWAAVDLTKVLLR